MVATDRLSAFDVVLPKGIPYKGQILNQIATKFMELTQDIVPVVDCNSDPSVARTFMCAFQSRNGYSWLHVWSCGS
jgi:phosphoribosylaminoimidazole-succinocarboxamide synthase